MFWTLVIAALISALVVRWIWRHGTFIKKINDGTDRKP
jgi:hypothetical protein